MSVIIGKRSVMGLLLSAIACFSSPIGPVTDAALEMAIRGVDGAAQAREAKLPGYVRTERYKLFRRGHDEPGAEIEVRSVYTRGQGNEYQVVAHSGSATFQVALNRVLKEEKILSQPDQRRRLFVTSENYSMTLIGGEFPCGQRRCLKLGLTPKDSSPHLLDGFAVVDAENYALVHVEGTTNSSASFLMGRAVINRDYKMWEGFEVSTRTQADTQSLLFGGTKITIEYTDYHTKR